MACLRREPEVRVPCSIAWDVGVVPSGFLPRAQPRVSCCFRSAQPRALARVSFVQSKAVQSKAAQSKVLCDIALRRSGGSLGLAHRRDARGRGVHW